MSNVTVTEAAKLTGKSRETINKATQTGNLTTTRNARNHKMINIAELERVFPLVRTMEEIQKNKTTKKGQGSHQSSTRETELEKEILSKEIEYLRRELTAKEQAIEKWQEAFEKAQTTAHKITALLEDHRSKSDRTKKDQENNIDVLAEAMLKMNQREDERIQRIEKRRAKARQAEKDRIAAEQGRGLFQKIFG